MTAPRAHAPATDQYGTKVKDCAPPDDYAGLAMIGYAVGRLKDSHCGTFYNAYLDGAEIIDGFTTALDAWRAIERYDHAAL